MTGQQSDMFTDEELSAWLDGEAPPELSARIAAARRTDAGLAEDIARLEAAGKAMKGGFEATLAGAPELPAALAAPEPSQGWTPGALGAGLVAGLALAALGLGAWSLTRPPVWERYVASYQALYVPQTIAGAGLSEEAARAQIAELAPQLGLDLSALPDLPGLELRRAQMLGLNGKPLLQIAYADTSGRPVALCIIARGKGPSDPVARRMEGLNAVAWSTEAHGFLLIGGEDGTLDRAAEAVRAAL